MRTLDEIVERKREGLDCDEDESCVVLRHFDRYSTPTEAANDDLAGLFPLEFDQWATEVDEGRRIFDGRGE